MNIKEFLESNKELELTKSNRISARKPILTTNISLPQSGGFYFSFSDKLSEVCDKNNYNYFFLLDHSTDSNLYAGLVTNKEDGAYKIASSSTVHRVVSISKLNDKKMDRKIRKLANKDFDYEVFKTGTDFMIVKFTEATKVKHEVQDK